MEKAPERSDTFIFTRVHEKRSPTSAVCVERILHRAEFHTHLRVLSVDESCKCNE